eukprot:915733-Pyramimonas_sp.AAC.1
MLCEQTKTTQNLIGLYKTTARRLIYVICFCVLHRGISVPSIARASSGPLTRPSRPAGIGPPEGEGDADHN